MPPSPFSHDGAPATELVESAPLPATTVTLVENSSFAITDACGDIGAAPVEGVFVGDTRICSHAILTVDQRPIEPLSFAVRTPSSAVFAGRSPDRRLLVFRELHVGQGMRMEVRIRNLAHERVATSARVDVGADLAHVFAVKSGHLPGPSAPCDAEGTELRFADPTSLQGAIVRGDGDARALDDGAIAWDFVLEHGRTWRACVEFAALRRGRRIEPTYACDLRSKARRRRQNPREREHPRLTSDLTGLAEAYTRSRKDLDALRLVDPHHPADALVAAGAPWYMTLFGRDSLITSWMALPFDPELALGSARALARMQGTRHDAETDEQPGKILHEIRSSGDASLALSDGVMQYGTIDATPLFVMLVHELWRWGASSRDIAALRPAVDAALAWLDGPGDPDGDGYIEYAPSTASILQNQGWKDSHDSVAFADGRLADAPIALAEVQGYAYAAWRAGASLSRLDGDDATAAERNRRADQLRAQFEHDFWIDDEQAFALGLDGRKRPIDAITSNMGHCLWTGIVADPRKAAAIARWLVSPELFTGWGIRTLATKMSRYSPLSYHNGSVWPHDTAICIEGLRRYGFTEEAHVVARGLLRAAATLDGRLPELFAGLTSDEMPIPVRYPTSCSPQAWASAAPLLVVRSILALDPDVPSGRVALDPALPSASTTLRVRGVRLAGSDVDIDVDGDAVAVRNLPRGLAMIRPAERSVD